MQLKRIGNFFEELLGNCLNISSQITKPENLEASTLVWLLLHTAAVRAHVWTPRSTAYVQRNVPDNIFW